MAEENIIPKIDCINYINSIILYVDKKMFYNFF